MHDGCRHKGHASFSAALRRSSASHSSAMLVVCIAACVVACCHTGLAEAALVVHEPYALKGNVPSALANFGAPPLTTRPIRGVLHVAEGVTGCTAVQGDRYMGKIVLATRGGCSFASKALAAQDGGALGIVIINSPDQTPAGESAGELFTMADDGQGMRVRIHAEMIGPVDGKVLTRAIQEYKEVVVASLGNIVESPMFML